MSEFFNGPIVLATDGSAEAEGARQAAAELSARSGMRLHVVHAWNDIPTVFPTIPVFGLGRWNSDIRADAWGLVEQEGERCRTAGARDVEVHVGLGRPMDVVGNCAEEVKACLVVAGSRGAGMVPRLLLGSVSEGLVQTSHRPVLVVRTTAGGWPPRAILAGDDGSEQAAAACAAASAFAGLLDIPFKVMMAYPARLGPVDDVGSPGHALLEQVEQDFGRRARAVEATATALRPGDPAHALLEEAGGPGTAVALGSHGAGAMSRLALGSVSAAVLHAHRGAVLVVPA